MLRRTEIFLVALAAAGICQLASPAFADSIGSAELESRLRSAYPAFVSGVDGDKIVFRDGSRLPITDGKDKPFDAWLANPDIRDMLEMGSYHFEMLNLGYGAYLTFREFCQHAFPGITDQTVTSMVSGIDILLFRPDDELRRLAHLAVALNVADILVTDEGPEVVLQKLKNAPFGGAWLEGLEKAKEPWFWFSTGVGYTHSDPVWMDDLRLPFTAIRGYIEALRRGEEIRRPLEQILEKRTRVTSEYRALLATDDDRAAFDGLIDLTRKVFPYVEDHNFYVEHWHHSIFWSKVRELGDVFVAHKFFSDREDIFYLHRHEIYDALYDLLIGWATGSQSRGEIYWKPIIAERRKIRDVLAKWSPPPALGLPPENITEPLTVMRFNAVTARPVF